MMRFLFCSILFSITFLTSGLSAFAYPAPAPCTQLQDIQGYPENNAKEIPVDVVLLTSWKLEANCNNPSDYKATLKQGNAEIAGTTRHWKSVDGLTGYLSFKPKQTLTPNTTYSFTYQHNTASLNNTITFATGTGKTSKNTETPQVTIKSSDYNTAADGTSASSCAVTYELSSLNLLPGSLLHVYAHPTRDTTNFLPDILRTHPTGPSMQGGYLSFPGNHKACNTTKICIGYRLEHPDGTTSEEKTSCQTPTVNPYTPPNTGCQQLPTTPISWLALFLLVGLLRHHRTRLNNTK